MSGGRRAPSDRGVTLRGMVQLLFECPTTGEPLAAARRFPRWTAEPDTPVTLHCPKCSESHTFARADAILMLGSEP